MSRRLTDNELRLCRQKVVFSAQGQSRTNWLSIIEELLERRKNDDPTYSLDDIDAAEALEADDLLDGLKSSFHGGAP